MTGLCASAAMISSAVPKYSSYPSTNPPETSWPSVGKSLRAVMYCTSQGIGKDVMIR